MESLHGMGRTIYITGDYYIGQHKENKRHGYGKYVYSDGAIQEGKWKNDEFLD
jgi:hypothetical protein